MANPAHFNIEAETVVAFLRAHHFDDFDAAFVLAENCDTKMLAHCLARMVNRLFAVETGSSEEWEQLMLSFLEKRRG